MTRISPSPRSRSLPIAVEEAASVRRLHCRRMAECAGVAARAGWRTFDRVGCAVRDDMDPDELRDDLRGIADALTHYVSPRSAARADRHGEGTPHRGRHGGYHRRTP